MRTISGLLTIATVICGGVEVKERADGLAYSPIEIVNCFSTALVVNGELYTNQTKALCSGITDSAERRTCANNSLVEKYMMAADHAGNLCFAGCEDQNPYVDFITADQKTKSCVTPIVDGLVKKSVSEAIKAWGVDVDYAWGWVQLDVIYRLLVDVPIGIEECSETCTSPRKVVEEANVVGKPTPRWFTPAKGQECLNLTMTSALESSWKLDTEGCSGSTTDPAAILACMSGRKTYEDAITYEAGGLCLDSCAVGSGYQGAAVECLWIKKSGVLTNAKLYSVLKDCSERSPAVPLGDCVTTEFVSKLQDMVWDGSLDECLTDC